MNIKSFKWKLYAVLFTFVIVVFQSEVKEVTFVSSLLNSNKNTPESEAVVTTAQNPLNILSLGGSVTWGAGLSDRDDAYPFLLRSVYNHKVQNLAIRGTGKSYYLQCEINHMSFENS